MPFCTAITNQNGKNGSILAKLAIFCHFLTTMGNIVVMYGSTGPCAYLIFCMRSLYIIRFVKWAILHSYDQSKWLKWLDFRKNWPFFAIFRLNRKYSCDVWLNWILCHSNILHEVSIHYKVCKMSHFAQLWPIKMAKMARLSDKLAIFCHFSTTIGNIVVMYGSIVSCVIVILCMRSLYI